MKQVRQVLFEYTTDNVELFSSEISTIEDKEVLLSLKKALVNARDCCNMVRTFGDDDLKQTFSKLEMPKIPQMISEVQHCIDSINQKEALYSSDSTAQMFFEAMQDIEFNFSKIGEEELKLASGGEGLNEKKNKAVLHLLFLFSRLSAWPVPCPYRAEQATGLAGGYDSVGK